MATREELEAAIAVVSWRREDLEVYADYLIEQGDPRGELITYDLELGRDPRPFVPKPGDWWSSPDPVRVEAIARWLGEDIAERASTCVAYGFVGNDAREPGEGNDAEFLAKLLDRAGPYVRDFGFRCERDDAERLLGRLAASPRPALVRLDIQVVSDFDVPLDPRLAVSVAAAAPNLDELVIDARNQVFLSFPHPRLSLLRVAGWRALGVTAGEDGPPMRVRELDLGFMADMVFADDPPPTAWSSVFPDVRALDLSRNEPFMLQSGDWGRAGATDAFQFLRATAIARRATHLRMPALRSPVQADNLERALDEMPRIVDVEIVRMYAVHADVLARLAHRMPPVRAPVVWTWPERLPGRAAVTFVVGSHTFYTEPASLVGHLERTFSELPGDAREAWLRIWTRLGALRDDAQVELPYEELWLALAPLQDNVDPPWFQFRSFLERHPGATIIARGSLSDPYRGTL